MKLPQALRVAEVPHLSWACWGVSPHSSLCTSKWKPRVPPHELMWVVLEDFYSFMAALFVPFSFTLIAFLSLSVAATLQFLPRLLLSGILLYSSNWFSVAQSFQFLLSFSSINCSCEFLPQIVLWFFTAYRPSDTLLLMISFSCIWKSSPPWLHLSITSSSMY